MVLMMQMTFINFAKIISTSASSLYVSKYSICFTKLKFLAANLKGQTLEIVPSLAISENQQRQDLIKACIPTTATPALTVLYPAFTQWNEMTAVSSSSNHVISKKVLLQLS